MHRQRRLPALITLGLMVLLACASVTAGAAEEREGPVVGLNCSREQVSGPRKCGAIGTTIARVEFSIATTLPTMGKFIRAYAARGIQVQPLAGFHGKLPTVDKAQNVRRWALRFGPHGAFWKGRQDGHLAVTNIEFGNETAYTYQYGDDFTKPSYSQRAREYALLAKDAALALRGTGVGLLVQAEDAGSNRPTWLNNMLAAVPQLDDLVAGWTIHPYGPQGSTRIDRMLMQLADAGMSSSVPFYVTEWGLATDDGRTLSNNYGYATNMTYAQAATTLRDVVAQWTSAYGDRFAQLIVYQHVDQRPSGTSSDREHYFGVLRKDGSDKGAYANEVRRLVRR